MTIFIGLVLRLVYHRYAIITIVYGYYVYYDTIGFLLSLLSKILITNYKRNFEKKLKLWDSMIWVSKIFGSLYLFMGQFDPHLFICHLIDLFATSATFRCRLAAVLIVH